MALKHTCMTLMKVTSMNEIFTLVDKDVTSDLVVDFWVRAQAFIRKRMADGRTLEEARLEFMALYTEAIPMAGGPWMDDPKLTEALDCAARMTQCPHRKLAD